MDVYIQDYYFVLIYCDFNAEMHIQSAIRESKISNPGFSQCLASLKFWDGGGNFCKYFKRSFEID